MPFSVFPPVLSEAEGWLRGELFGAVEHQRPVRLTPLRFCPVRLIIPLPLVVLLAAFLIAMRAEYRSLRTSRKGRFRVEYGVPGIRASPEFGQFSEKYSPGVISSETLVSHIASLPVTEFSNKLLGELCRPYVGCGSTCRGDQHDLHNYEQYCETCHGKVGHSQPPEVCQGTATQGTEQNAH